MVQVVAERLWGNMQLSADSRRTALLREHLENPEFLFGERFDRSVMGRVVGECYKLPCGLQHPGDQFFVAPVILDTTCKPDEEK